LSTDACTVIIAAADRLSQIKDRVGAVNGEVLDFTDADALTALETIIKRRPQLVALERLFAATPRGTALINRIKADKKLAKSEIKVYAHDSDVTRVVPRATAQPGQALDQRGTRRAPRFKMVASTAASVDGKNAVVIDLSTIGAQVVSPAMLKPNQTVVIVLMDKQGWIRFNGTVVWTSFEIPPNSGPRYRAGVEFVDADPVDVDAFCQRHKVS
jgi:PilZ domain-containing protein